MSTGVEQVPTAIRYARGGTQPFIRIVVTKSVGAGRG
jgi:hypothetical protein